MAAILYWYRNYRDPGFVVPIVRRHRERASYQPPNVRRPDYFMRPEQIQELGSMAPGSPV